MAEFGPMQYVIWNTPFIWINAFSLLISYLLTHGQTPGTLASNPAIGKVDEMVEPDTSQVNLDY